MVGGYVGAKIGFSAGILKQTLIEAALPMDRIINSLSMKQSFQKLWNRKAEIGRDIIQGVKGGTQGIDKLMNMDTSSMTPKQQVPLNYLKFRYQTAPSNSRDTLIDLLKRSD